MLTKKSTVISLVIFLLLLPSLLLASGGQRIRVGYVAAKGIVKSPEGNPYWVEYDDEGNVVAFIGEVTGDLANSTVMSGDDYRIHLAGFEEVKSKHAAHLLLLAREEYEAADRVFTNAVGDTIEKTALLPSTRYVVVRTSEVLYSKDDLILYESPLNLELAVQIESDIRSVLLNQDGVVVHQAKVNIGYQVAFYSPLDYLPGEEPTVDMSDAGNLNMWDFKSSDHKLWGPIEGVMVESSLGRMGAPTNTDGYYNLTYYLPPCPGFTFFYDSTMLATLKYKSFNPNGERLYSYYATSPDNDACSGLGDFGTSSYSLVGLLGQMAGMDTDGSVESSVTMRTKNFGVDMAVLSGEADLRNRLDEDVLPQGQDTAYGYTEADYLPLVPQGDINGDGYADHVKYDTETNKISIWLGRPNDSSPPDLTGSPDLVRQADFDPDFTDQGLVKEVSQDDLRNTDTYIYRVSNGQLFSAREGLLGGETEEVPVGDVSNTTDTTIYYRQIIRGPRTTSDSQEDIEIWQAKTNVSEELRGWQADHIRTGEQLKVIMINRATGYMGSSIATYGENTEEGGIISFTPEKIHMLPPNLKIKVERTKVIDAGATAGQENIYTIGFEGSGLTSDKYIVITTEWFDQDGSPLPEDLPGYTGRLAKVVGLDQLGQASGRIDNFPIRPGRNMVVVQLPQEEIDSAHYYVHVNGEPMEGSPDFSSDADFTTTGAGEGLLQYRPKHYVPIQVPLYDQELTESAEEIRQQAIAYGGDSASLPEVEPVYQWPYRPEMQFSLFDLVIKGGDDIRDPEDDDDTEYVVIYDSGSTNESLLEYYNQIFMELLKEDETFLPMLQGFGPDREFVLHLGNQEVVVKLNELGQVVFEVTNTDILKPEDWLTLSLYQNGDDPNKLWEYKLDLEIVKVELDVPDRPKEQSSYSLPVDETGTLVATTKPEGRKVTWSIVYKADGVLISKFDPETGEIRLHPESEIDKIRVRATDSFNPYVTGDFIINCEVCNKQAAGDKSTKIGSIDATFSLGEGSRGESAGKLYIAAQEITNQTYTPIALKLSSTLLGSSVVNIRDDFTLAYRQVLAPQVLVDIQTEDSSSYRLDYYKRADVKGLSVNYGEYGSIITRYELQPGAEPYVTYSIDNPDATATSDVSGESKSLRITESRPGEEDVVDIYTWLEDQHTWRLAKANNTAVYEEQSLEYGSGETVTVKTVMDGNGEVGGKVETVTQAFPWGDEIIRSTLDPGGANLVTLTSFYTNGAESGFGQLHTRINPDSSWIRYTYDTEGRKKQYIRSYLDSDSSAGPDQAHTISYDYTPVDPQDSNLTKDKDNPRTITETILGTIVSETFYSYQELSSGERVITEEQCASASCSFGAADNLTTITTLNEDGRVKSVVMPDGQKTSYTYTDTGEEIINGIVTAEAGVAFKTTKEIITRDHYNNVKRMETHVYTGEGYELTEWSQNELDDLGRIEKTSYSNGTMIEPASSSCCSTVKTSSDRTGVVTKYFYDGMKRLEKTEREGPKGTITTTYVYDAAGRQIEQIRESGGLSQTTKTSYDSSGRIETTTDAAGLVTRYDYSSDGLTTTVTRPGDITEITTTYPDGRVKSVTGTAVIPSYYEYGVNQDGSQWTIVRSGSLDSPRYQKSTTDILGRVIETEQPGYNGTIVSKNFYNEKGQLYRTTSTGRADQLYEYDEVGNQIASGIDIDGSGELDRASSDRISETRTFYRKYDDNWFRESAGYVYSTEGSADSTLVSVNRSQISGLGFAAYSISEDIHGNKTISKTAIDRDSQTVTQTIDYPDSGTDAVSVSVGGYQMSSTTKTGQTYTFDYDALGRRTSTTDPRTGTSVTHYNDKGRVDYVDDAAGNRIEFGYDPETGRKAWEKNALGKYTRYSYNVQGQVTGVWGEATYPVSYEYDSYGQRTHMYTYQGGSGWSSETWSADIGSASATIWHYDEETGLLTAKEDAAGKQVYYSYTQTGQLQTRTWARQDEGLNLSTTYSYDSNTAELQEIDYSDTTPDVGFTYDRLGRQQSITDAVGSRGFTYTNSLQLESETISGLYSKTITRNYATSDVIGRPTGFNVGSEYTASYDYDAATGRFNSVAWDVNGEAGSVNYGYVANSNLLQSVSFSSGHLTTYGYEPNRNLKTSISNAFNVNLISQYEYSYDALGRRENVRNSGSAFSADAFNLYGYNDRNELIASDHYLGTDVNNTTQSVESAERGYIYDNIGNRKQATGWDNDSVPLQLTYTANQLNQYDLITADSQADQTPSFDDDGNMTGYGSKVYTYNGENRLVAVEPELPAEGNKRLEFVYDYMGRRVSKKVFSYTAGSWVEDSALLFVYDGWNMIEELDEAGLSLASYVWGLDLSQSLQGAGGVGGLLARIDEGGAYSYTFDGNVNVGQVLDGAGGIGAHYEYDPYGNSVKSVGTLAEVNPYRFSTKYFDTEAGVYYYGYRYYMPELGRWLSRDPIGEDGGVNLYGLCLNDSINIFDVNGLYFKGYPTSPEEAFRQLGAWGESFVNQIKYQIDKILVDTNRKLKNKFDEWANEARYKRQSQVQDRYKLGFLKYFELNGGFSGKAANTGCETIVSGSFFVGVRAKFPFASVGFADASIVPGGSLAATLSGKYNWAQNTVDYEGQYKVGIFVGLRVGFEHEVKLLNVGASLFGEMGIQIGNTLSFEDSKWGEWKVGGYLRGVAEYNFTKSHVQRYEYKESFGGDVNFF